MLKWIKYVGVTALLSHGLAVAQSTEGEREDQISADDQVEYSEVYGISRSDHTPQYSEAFALVRSADIPELPQTREEWLEIAQHIRDSDINFEIYYAILRGNPPDDIFTPELMAIYQPKYEAWLLAKMDAEEQEAGELYNGDFLTYAPVGEDGDRSCDPDREEDLAKIADSTALPTTEQLNKMYQIMMGEIACQKSDKDRE